MSIIKEWSLKTRTSFSIRSGETFRVSCAYEQAKSIGVLSSLAKHGDEKITESLITRLESDHKQVNQLVFVRRMNQAKPITHDGFFSEKDVDYTGRWTRGHVNQFINESFDFLIYLGNPINTYVKNVLALSKAKCRVGQYAEDVSQYFELMIHPASDDYLNYLNQLYQYIKSIRNGK